MSVSVRRTCQYCREYFVNGIPSCCPNCGSIPHGGYCCDECMGVRELAPVLESSVQCKCSHWETVYGLSMAEIEHQRKWYAQNVCLGCQLKAWGAHHA
jgi:hypothetical protein